MDPSTIALGAMAVSSLVQLYNSQQARGASAQTLKGIEDLYDKVKPPNYDLSIHDPPELHNQELQKPQFSDPLQAPKFDTSALTPKDMQMIGTYTPTLASYIQQAAPQTVQDTATSKTTKDAQMAALQKFMQIGQTGNDPIYQAQQAEAARRAQTEAQSRQASILQDFARRGQATSGASLAAQLSGTGQAMDRQAMAAQQGAADAYRNRLSALSQGAGIAGQVNQQEMSQQSRNAQIINDFNAQTSRNQQAYQNARAGALSDASRYNLGTAQGIANANNQTQNQYALANRQRLDDLAKYGANFQAGQQARQDQLKQWGYGQDVNALRYNNELAMQKAAWPLQQQYMQNQLTGQVYNQNLQRAGIMGGLMGQGDQMNRQNTQDINTAIGGLGSATASYMATEKAQGNAAVQQTGADDRTQYQRTGNWMSPEERQQRYDYYRGNPPKKKKEDEGDGYNGDATGDYSNYA